MEQPIDFVVLWVDGSDPAWQQERARYCPQSVNNGNSENRYRDWDLMRYWFRGVETYAPWVHRIFFVTNGQVPAWMNLRHPKLRLVKHSDYIPENDLPTFNSNVIELHLHRIPDLAEHFVLFNDDMFLTSPVKPEDFFRDGLPCEMALMDLATAPGPEDCLPHMLINNFSLINRHFQKKEVMRRNWRKFFTLKYGKELVRNLCLVPFQYFSCFRDSHLPTSYRKSTFVKVWQEEGELLDQCSHNRFRSKSDLTHWLMKCWQICEGMFVPRSIRWGRHFELWEDDIEGICSSIQSGRYHAVCLNDSKMEIDFDSVQKKLSESFETILPVRSSYEWEEEQHSERKKQR
ncbi:MAG: Stealth CR1 domain-containing protein [Fusicatenibacter sp.]|nr:Stealth CR1 domain-containing protein [Fusicatenibacter sp.]